MKKNFSVSALTGLLVLFFSHGVWGQTIITFDEIATATHLSLNGTGTYDNSGVRFSIIPGSNGNARVSSADDGLEVVGYWTMTIQ